MGICRFTGVIMANDFDQFPLYDALTSGDHLSNIWFNSISTFYQNLIGYLSSTGIFLPVLTTTQRNQIQSPQEGQMIYTSNTTVGPSRTASLQVWQVKAGAGAWRTITTTP